MDTTEKEEFNASNYEGYSPLVISEATTDFTMAYRGLLLENDPGWKVSESLFGDFLSCQKEYSKSEDILELVANFIQLCEDQICIMDKLCERASNEEVLTRTALVKQQIMAEKDTWTLFHTLYMDRLSKSDCQEMEEDEAGAKCDFESFERLVNTNTFYRELKLIIKWTESNAAGRFDDSVSLKHFEKVSFIWENGLHSLKPPNVRPQGSMDPDAVIRGAYRLNPKDAENEAMLIRQLFIYVRCGQLDKAVKLCCDCGEAWRAAALEGKALYDDPNFCRDRTELHEADTPMGNHARGLWKTICWKLAENPKLQLQERALWGSLSGKLSAMLPLCKTWEDRLWALCTAAAESTLESDLKSAGTQERVVANEDVADFDMLGIFQELEAATEPKIQEQKRDPYNVIQKCLILGDPETLIRALHKWITSQEEIEAPRHLVRLLAHMVLIFRLKPTSFPHDKRIGNKILALYVGQLGDDDRREEIAFYAAALPHPLRSEAYARFLQRIHGTNERLEALKKGVAVGMNMEEIAVMVVENSIKAYFETGGEMGDTEQFPQHPLAAVRLPDKDEDLCSSLEWVLFDRNLRLQTINIANELIRKFLVRGRNAAARKVISMVKMSSSEAERISETGSKETLPLRLHFSYRCYLDALNEFGEWNQHFHRKPIEPSVRDALSFTDKARQENATKAYESQLAQWKRESETYAESALDRLMFLLSIPGGWLHKEQMVAEDNDESRRMEMELVQRTCIPLVVSMTVHLFSRVGRHRDALKVAEVLTSEDTQLYRFFDKGELRSLLKTLSDCSIAAQESGLDSVGLSKLR